MGVIVGVFWVIWVGVCWNGGDGEWKLWLGICWASLSPRFWGARATFSIWAERVEF